MEEESNYVGQRSQNLGFKAYLGQYGPKNYCNSNQWQNVNQWTPPYVMRPPPTSWGPLEWISPQWNQLQLKPNQPPWQTNPPPWQQNQPQFQPW